MNAASLLASNPSPTDSDIENAMQGNICRCGTYNRIKAAIRSVSTAPDVASRTTADGGQS